MNKLASKFPWTETGRNSEEPEVEPPTSVLERFDAGTISLHAAREVRNREIHLPPVSVYRWWARRTEAVFGGILDAFFADRPGPGLVVDPFCGGGVIPLAAAIRGHHVYAQDLNPWAMQGLSGMLRLPSPDDIEQLTRKLKEAAEPLLHSAYATTFSDGEPATISHTFRVTAFEFVP
jgi:putative DNA methylase